MTISLIDALTEDDLGGAIPGNLDATVFGKQALALMSARFVTLRNEPSALATVSVSKNGAFAGTETTGSDADRLEGLAFMDSQVTAYRSGKDALFYLSGRTRDEPPTGLDPDFAGLTVLRSDKTGALEVIQQVESFDFDWNSPTAVVGTGTRDYLIARTTTDDQLVSYRIRNDGTLKEAARSDALADAPVPAMATVQLRGESFVISNGRADEAPLVVHRVAPNGTLETVFEADPEDPHFRNQGTSAITAVEIGNSAYVSVIGIGAEISTFELGRDGSLTKIGGAALDLDILNGGAPNWIDYVDIGGDPYLFAGGVRGNGLYAVSPHGTLVQTSQIFASGGIDPGIRTGAVVEIGNRDFVIGAGETLNSLRLTADDPTFESGRSGDTFLGTIEADWIVGARGKDSLSGGDGEDLILGGGGKDTISGGDDTDHLHGDGGRDVVDGGGGRDWITGDGGGDRLTGGDDADTLRGGNGNDTLFGGNDGAVASRSSDGGDLLEGGKGRDYLAGGDGDDTLVDGPGLDTLFGGDDADVFVLVPDGTRDIIEDFEDGRDLIDLRGQPGDLRFADIDVRSTDAGTLITWEGDSVLLEGSFAPAPSLIGLEDFLLT